MGPGVAVYFRDLEDRLVEHIEAADAVFGAVAWLTSSRVLSALAGVPDAQIVVQKEDFLRPDGEAQAAFHKRLRNQYNMVGNDLGRYEHQSTILPCMSYAHDPRMQGVRCVGNHNSDQAPTAPRMHNKFLVFARVLRLPEGQDQWSDNVGGWWPRIAPYGVWTGSFNMTVTAGRSFENAVYITGPEVVAAYYQEWAQIAALSEPLEWSTDWMAPEWRLGS